MKYNELLKKVETARALKGYEIDCEKKIITIKYKASTITDEVISAVYNITLDDELKKLMNITGETKLDKNIGIEILDVDDNTVKIRPKYNANIGGFVSWRGYNNYYLLYNDNVIISNTHISKNCIYGCVDYVEKAIDIYEGHLIAKYNEYVSIIDTKGNISRISYYPEPESGRDDHVEVYIGGSTLFVNVYCYYDCDLKHGGWEENEYNLDDEIAKIPNIIIYKAFDKFFKEHNNPVWDGEYKCTVSGVGLSRNYNVGDKAKIEVNYKKSKRTRFLNSVDYGKISILAEIKNGQLEYEVIEDDGINLYKFSNMNEEDTVSTIKGLVANNI